MVSFTMGIQMVKTLNQTFRMWEEKFKVIDYTICKSTTFEAVRKYFLSKCPT